MISRILRSSRLPLERLRRQEPRPDQLLGDRRAAARVAAEGVERAETKAPMSKPGFVQKSLSSIAVVASSISRRDLVERDDLALELAEARQLDLAGPIVDAVCWSNARLLRVSRGSGRPWL